MSKIDQKRHKTNTIDSTNQDESSEVTKLIPRPKTTKILSRMQNYKRLNKMCLEKNLVKQLASLKRSQKDLSNDIKNS